MTNLYAFAAPLVLALPFLGQATLPSAALAGGNAPNAQAPDHELPSQAEIKSDIVSSAPSATTPLNAFNARQVVRQVRIEQRVVVRISPQRGNARNNLIADLPQQALNARFEERDMDQCLPVSRIGGVQTGSGNRLLLFLRDKRIITVNLEKACRARDFYSGFYVERNKDGKLCVDRDKLQSRTGAKCEVERMRQLVAVSN